MRGLRSGGGIKGFVGDFASDDGDDGAQVFGHRCASVSGDGAQGLGEEEEDAEQAEGDHDDDAPEYGAPAEFLG